VAVANWKMAMTVGESLAFVHTFREAAGDLTRAVDVVLCPPFTALHPVAQVLAGSGIQLAGQSVAPGTQTARTGQVSAALLRDADCGWVLLGHWEVRRHLGVSDAVVRQQLEVAFEAGLRPIVGVGEGREEPSGYAHALTAQLDALLGDLPAKQVGQTVLMAEPEWTIGREAPALVDDVADRVRVIRGWLSGRFGEVADRVRVFYGGSVTPEGARTLLKVAGLDGLGVGRKGRDPVAFAEVVRTVAQSRGAGE
jgi:triosephosphate isomerase